MAPKVLRCAICNEPNAKACSGCLSSAYCSAICQQTDWKLHKIFCKKYKEFLLTRPPGHRVAVFFPEDAIQPRLIWAKVEDEGTENVELEESIECKELLGPYSLASSVLDGNVLRRFEIDHIVNMGHRDCFLGDGSVYNQSIGHTTGLGRSSYWKGPFLFSSSSRIPNKRGEITRVLDFTLADLRLAVDRLYHQGSFPYKVLSITVAPEAFAVKGVMIHCDGAMAAMNVPRYVPVSVPEDHPIFSSSPPIRLTEILKLSLLAFRQPTDLSHSPRENIPVTLMHRDLSTTCPAWGFTAPAWSGAIGNVLIVHRDRKSITTRQIEAIVELCQDWLEPKFQELRSEAPDVVPTATEIKARMEAYLSIFSTRDMMRKLLEDLFRPTQQDRTLDS